MTAITLVLGDQLTPNLAALRAADPATDIVLLAEVATKTAYVAHHQQKIALVLSAMRHFAEALRAAGRRVDYVRLDAPDNTGSLLGELGRAVQRHQAEAVRVTEPGEWRLAHDMDDWPERLGVAVHRHADDCFLCSYERFEQWANGRKQWRTEHFYRAMRREHDVLMEGREPAGGQWNFDTANRKPLPKTGLNIPAPDGNRQLRPTGRRRPGRNLRVVSDRLRRRL